MNEKLFSSRAQRLSDATLIAIFRMQQPEHAVEGIGAAVRGGFEAVEITMNTPGATDAMAELGDVYVNDAFLRLTGYAREQLLGRNCRLLQGPGTDRTVVARIGASRETPEQARALVNGGPYTLALSGNITLTQSLPILRGDVAIPRRRVPAESASRNR